MKKTEEYRQRAIECRNLAKNSPGDMRAHYEELAAMWDRMAEERLSFFVPSPEKPNA